MSIGEEIICPVGKEIRPIVRIIDGEKFATFIGLPLENQPLNLRPGEQPNLRFATQLACSKFCRDGICAASRTNPQMDAEGYADGI